MYCLFNGEYGDHDLSHVPGLTVPGGVLDRQKEQYKHYIGMIVGDFTVLNVEYDWGRRDQRWKVKCNYCGNEIYQYHTQDWRRGKGKKITCDCLKIREKDRKKEEHEEEVKKKAIEREELSKIKLEQNKSKYKGKVFFGWEITECFDHDKCQVRCAECGREIATKRSISKVERGEYAKCIHPIDYSGDEWIGKKIGHLTVVGREGKYFVYKCDCGNKRISSPSLAFRLKSITNCGRSDCPYMDKIHKGVAKAKEIGQQYETDMLNRLIMQGYNAKTTCRTGDYGVDIIAIDNDGSQIAIQCKYHKKIVGVEAIQAVYAGGRFYDCTKFAVISDSGFTNNAIIMAKKLGIYLSNGNFKYPSNMQKYSEKLLPVYKTIDKNKKYYEINGERHTLGDWCAIYNAQIRDVRKNLNDGMSIEIALQHKRNQKEVLSIDGFTGTKKELAMKYNMSYQLLDYRLRKGMTLEEALKTPVKQQQKGA